MSVLTACFSGGSPVPWAGRYARIPGDTTVFHLRLLDGQLWPVVLWDTDDGRLTCPAIPCEAAEGLARAVARAKRAAGGSGAGCFLINEFGQVLVSASDGGGRRFLAGELEGSLLFDNPLCPGEPIDLSAHDGLQCGDPWELPYVGVPHNLHASGKIYFYRQDADGGAMTLPPRQDPALVRALRSVRPYGAARFVVNSAGLVLTRRPPSNSRASEDSWQPVFVGSVSHTHWFEKE